MNKNELIEKYKSKIESCDEWLADGSEKSESQIEKYKFYKTTFEKIVEDLNQLAE